MNFSRLARALLGGLPLLACFALGCAPSSVDEEVDANESSILLDQRGATSATLKANEWSGGDRRCMFAAYYFSVELPDAFAASRINEKLSAYPRSLLDGEQCKDTRDTIASRQFVALNDAGLLSIITHTAGVWIESPYKAQNTWLFDLETGSVLHLSDVLDKQGHAIVIDQCKTALANIDGAETGSEETFAEICTDSVLGWGDPQAYGAPIDPAFTVENAGLRLHPSKLENDEVARKGMLVPWSALSGHITSAKVAALASSK